MSSDKILLVDDEPDILEFISYNLIKEGYRVDVALNGVEGFEKAKKMIPKIILLDIMMPKMDGIEMCKLIKSKVFLKETLVVFLTACLEEYSHLAAFEAGADDYITKPIKPRILISKIRALLRRAQVEDIEEVIKVDSILIDRKGHKVSFNGIEIPMPKKEFNMLALLASNPQRVFKREEILAKVWTNEIVGERTIDVHLRKLREKFGNSRFSTIKGVGYKMNPQ